MTPLEMGSVLSSFASGYMLTQVRVSRNRALAWPCSGPSRSGVAAAWLRRSLANPHEAPAHAACAGVRGSRSTCVRCSVAPQPAWHGVWCMVHGAWREQSRPAPSPPQWQCTGSGGGSGSSGGSGSGSGHCCRARQQHHPRVHSRARAIVTRVCWFAAAGDRGRRLGPVWRQAADPDCHHRHGGGLDRGAQHRRRRDGRLLGDLLLDGPGGRPVLPHHRVHAEQMDPGQRQGHGDEHRGHGRQRRLDADLCVCPHHRRAAGVAARLPLLRRRLATRLRRLGAARRQLTGRVRRVPRGAGGGGAATGRPHGVGGVGGVGRGRGRQGQQSKSPRGVPVQALPLPVRVGRRRRPRRLQFWPVRRYVSSHAHRRNPVGPAFWPTAHATPWSRPRRRGEGRFARRPCTQQRRGRACRCRSLAAAAPRQRFTVSPARRLRVWEAAGLRVHTAR